MAEDLGIGLKPGDSHYRAYVGPPEDYDLVAAMTFGLLTTLGLRQHHRLLDIGCGSLRNGRLFIPYLNNGNYVGIEPNQWLVEEGISQEIGQNLVDLKQPHFYFTDSADALPEEPFDFAVAQSIFSHTGADLLERWLSQITKILKPTGAMTATFHIGTDDPTESGWVYPACVKFKLESMHQLAMKHGLLFGLLDWRHPRQSWAIFAKPQFNVTWLLNRPLTWNTWLQFGPK
jgi:cyclopropane fatty-acyl-phospholipid synthase-like methyltransferase